MPSRFTEKCQNDLDLLLNKHVETVKSTLPKYGDAFEKRIREDIQQQAALVIDKLDSIRTSGRYSEDGDRQERRLSAHAFHEHLAKVRTATVEKLEQERKTRTANALKSKPTTDALSEMKAQETRALARQLPPLELQARIMQDDGSTGFLDALEGAPPGFPVAPADLLKAARNRIAEANDPELGELATLQKAYEFALGATEQVVIEASGLRELEVVTNPATR